LRNERDTDKEILPKRYEMKRDWRKVIMNKFKTSTPSPIKRNSMKKSIYMMWSGYVAGTEGGEGHTGLW
jgi:hypothetical protein